MKKNVFALVLIAFTINVFSQTPQIVITEMMYNPYEGANPPMGSSGVEYLELYNNDASVVNLNGYSFDGITFTFGNVNIPVGGTILLSNDSIGFTERYGMVARDYGGSLSNNGETILLLNNSGATVDSVPYVDGAPWPVTADGLGSAMILCSAFADNAVADFWGRSLTNTGIKINGREIYGSPGSQEVCTGLPIVSFVSTEAEFYESAGTVEVFLSIDNSNPTSSGVFATVTSLTANVPADVTTGNQGVTFFGNTTTLLSIEFDIVDDTLVETSETFMFAITVSSNCIITTDTMVVTIIDNDGPVAKDIILTGVWEAAVGFGFGTGTTGFELYTRAAIADMSIYGFGSATNGGGSDGIEWSFPPVPWPANTPIYVADDSAEFRDFFGFDADFIFGNGGFSGDDAIELFELGTVIDLVGLIDVDGSGEVWEYTNGWLYRVDGTGPDCDVFNPANWTYSGIDVYDNTIATNSAANPPYPIGTYVYMVGTAGIATSISAADVSNNGNGTDLEVSFTKAADETTVSDYRIITVKTADAASFDLTAANAVTDYFTVSPTGSNIVQTLAANQNDKDGALIIAGVPYKTFVLSIADGVNATVNSLSAESNEVTLDNMTSIYDVENPVANIYSYSNSIYVKDVVTTNKYDLGVFDAVGREIVSLNNVSGDQQIDMTNKEAGVYFVKLNVGAVQHLSRVVIGN